MIKRIAIISFLFYILLHIVMYFAQDSLLFPVSKNIPTKSPYSAPTDLAEYQYAYLADDGFTQRGFLKTTDKNEPLTIYFGGNGEFTTNTFRTWVKLPYPNLLITNYRGFESSEGKPSQDKIFSDALGIMNDMRQKGFNKFILIGRSLGSGVACYLASKNDCEGLVLITPYDSVENVAQAQYPILFIKLLIKHPFRSIEYVKNIKCPVLVLRAEFDGLIPANSTIHLYNAIPSAKELIVIEKKGHNNIQEHPLFQKKILEFSKRFQSDQAVILNK